MIPEKLNFSSHNKLYFLESLSLKNFSSDFLKIFLE
jgi:hypothetical protein